VPLLTVVPKSGPRGSRLGQRATLEAADSRHLRPRRPLFRGLAAGVVSAAPFASAGAFAGAHYFAVFAPAELVALGASDGTTKLLAPARARYAVGGAFDGEVPAGSDLQPGALHPVGACGESFRCPARRGGRP
jgi:hypothetical protein